MREPMEKFSLSLTQKDIYFDQLHCNDSPLYNIGGYIRCTGLDVERMCLAHKKVVMSHDAFGIRIVAGRDDVEQYISVERNAELALVDFSEEANAEQLAIDWINHLFQTPLPFHDHQLCYAYLLKLTRKHYWYVGLSHHLAMDGWGFSNWAHKLADYYNDAEFVEGDNGHWQGICEKDQSYISSTRYQGDKGYWLEHCADIPERILTSHYLVNFPDAEQIPSSRHRIPLSRATFEHYAKVAEDLEVGVPQLFLGILSCYFALSSECSHVCFGVPAHNRRNSIEKKLIAVFTSVSPLIVKVDKNYSFRTLLQQLAKLQKSSFRHQRFPIGHLMQSLGLSGLRNGLYDISFNYLKLDYTNLAFDGINADVVYHNHGRDKTPITITIWDGDGDYIEMHIDYNHAYFAHKEIQLLGERFIFLLEQVTAQGGADLAVEDLKLLPEQEVLMLSRQFQTEATAYERGRLIHELFEAQVNLTPDTTAVVCGRRTLSYNQLNQSANRLARHLRELGIQSEDLVGLCLNRSEEMLVAILAVFKAGGAYVPMDPDYPKNRLDYIVQDASLRFIISHESLKPVLGLAVEQPIIDLGNHELNALLSRYNDCNLEPRRDKQTNKLAYVIYTSGSTGVPKGVQIEHRNTVAFLHWTRGYFSDSEMRCVLASTSLNFDLSIFELLAPLVRGGACLIVENILALMHKNFDAYGISMINSVPSGVAAVLKENCIPASVITVNLAGEPLPKSLVNGLHQTLKLQRVINLYGPSEDTTYSTVMAMPHIVETEVLIGRPINNTTAYVLNSQRQLVPMGVPGELYLGGEGLARGYLNMPDMTAKVFIDNPFGGQSDKRLYKTGDLVRYLPDGNLSYKGRIDTQVKIRGFRIELTEIEYHLSRCPEVASVVVLARDDHSGNKYLIAYVQKQDSSEEKELVAKLKQHLRLNLPQYMQPSAILFVEQWPQTLNGKIDKNALPAPDYGSLEGEYISPETPDEKMLCTIWAELLGIVEENISTTANFFSLGGHSLLVMRLVAEIRIRMFCELPFEQVFSATNLQALAYLIEVHRGQGQWVSSGKANEEHGEPVMSFSQQSLWVIQQMSGNGIQYNMPAVIHVTGDFVLNVAQQAVLAVIRRHQPLSTVFREQLGEVISEIRLPDAFPVEYHFLSDLKNEELQSTIDEIICEFSYRPFDLSNDLMVRMSYLHLSGERETQNGMLLFNFHHVAFDGWSIGVFVNEFNAFYRSIIENRDSVLPSLSSNYSDYAHWQRRQLQGPLLGKQLEYWNNQLANLPQLHSLPLDYPRPSVLSFSGATHFLKISESKSAALAKLCREHNATLFMGLHAVFAVLLARYSNEKDIVIGTPVANRDKAEYANLIGLFVNSVVLRSDLSCNPDFVQLISRSKEVMQQAYAHQDVPFEQIVEFLNPTRSLGNSPLFQVMMVLQSSEDLQFDLPNVTLQMAKQANLIAKYDLTLNIRENADGLLLGWEYNTGLFSDKTIVALADHFELLLDCLIASPYESVFKAKLLSEDEQKQQLVQWSQITTDFVSDKCIHEVFEEQAAKDPDAVAVVFPGVESECQEITYGELNAQANRLAAYLIEERRVVPETLIGIYFTRSIDMLIAILGVLKAGCAYVPLDPSYPLERLNHILEDAKLTTVLTQTHLSASTSLGRDRSICLDDPSFRLRLLSYSAECILRSRLGLTVNHLAYVIYTSGSTGLPKGVLIEHKNVTRLFSACGFGFSFNKSDVWTLFHSVAFDFSVWEIWGAFFHGAKLVIVPHDTARSAIEFHRLLEKENVTVLSQTPSAFGQLLEVYCQYTRLRFLRYVVFGGEQLNLASLTPWVSTFGDDLPQLINMYGITETTVHVTYKRITKENIYSAKNSSLIGKALADLSVVILDADLNLVPAGVIGEMYIGGAGVARGYLNRPELTAERFINNPFYAPELVGGSKKLYRSGDLARWLPDGSLEYHGRMDHQVKIRGFRIELGEIEHTLSALASVSDSLVLARDFGGGEKQLLAYIISPKAMDMAGEDEHCAILRRDFIGSIRQELSKKLPSYMIPDAFVLLPVFPLTVNGKVDHSRLPLPDLLSTQVHHVAPQTLIEHQLAACWAQLLGLDVAEISATANFFEIGGNSLLSSKMIHLSSERQLMIGIRDIFECPTIQSLAARVNYNAGNQTQSAAIASLHQYIQPEHVPLSYTQYRIWLLEMLKGSTGEHNMPIGMKINGRLDRAVAERVFTFMLSRHDGLRTQLKFHNGQPYQVVLSKVENCFEFFDLSSLSDTERGSKARELTDSHGMNIFDINRAPLISALLIKLAEEQYLFHINFHHLISDGWSVVIFINEFLSCYDAFYKGDEADLPPLHASYLDYSLWQHEFQSTENARRQEHFWSDYLSDSAGQLSLPFQYKAEQQSFGEGVCTASIDSSVVDALQNLGSKHQGSLFNVVHTALVLLLGRVSGEHDFNIGIPTAGRHVPGTHNIIGAFINNLPVRSKINLAQPFSAMLSAEIKNVAAVLSNQDIPFERILALTGVHRSTEATPLFQIFLNMLSLPEPQRSNSSFELSMDHVPELGSKFNMTFYIMPSHQGLDIRCHFNGELFSSADVHHLLAQYVSLLQQLATDGERICGNYSLRLSRDALPDLTQSLSLNWQGSVHHCFEKIARESPELIAVEFAKQQWNYRELNCIANHYAIQLIDRGVKSGDVVAIMAQRTDLLVIATLAVLKAGAAFMLLSTSVPTLKILQQVKAVAPKCLIHLNSSDGLDIELRNHFIQNDCMQLTIVSDRSLLPENTPAEEFESVNVDPDAAVCIGFTSGTSGQPKTVIGRHSSLSIFMPWMAQTFGLSVSDRFGMMSGLVHDPLQRDIFTPLCLGATLCIPTENDFSVSRLNDWLLERHISVLHLTPSLGNMLSGSVTKPISSLRKGFFVGEPLTSAHIHKFKQIAPQMSVINLYGSTETSRAVSYYQVNALNAPAVIYDEVLPVGQGIAGVQLIILNSCLEPCGIGEVGQIGVRSEHLSLGYGNDAELTALKFIGNPALSHHRDVIYLTGDMGRYRLDGEVVCLGRIDKQVKIRGFRVELAEIEAAIKRHDCVHQVAVTTQQNALDELAIVACIVLKDQVQGITFETELRDWLAGRIPNYMVPAHLVVVDEIPLTENGKLDSNKLKSLIHISNYKDIIKPDTSTEAELLLIWQEILGVERICMLDNFFSIGGHSLLATRLLARIQQEYAFNSDYKAFFDDSSIRSVAQRIDNFRLVKAVVNSGTKKNKVIL